jgi:tRNA U34 5-methylaminomethyl-2-thiouridine-forming methyltransferase MnmC
MTNIERRVTNDGSHTLFLPDLGESYHSTHGAISESQHIYIEAGFHYALERAKNVSRGTLRILEVGFGTGLNALMTQLECERLMSEDAPLFSNFKVDYVALEPFPLPHKVLSKLNYAHIIGGKSAAVFSQLHSSPFSTSVQMGDSFVFTKWETPLENFNSQTHFDLVYFDAFAPKYQPEMWTEYMFKHVFSLLNSGAILVTYSSKGDVRRALLSCGFDAERLPGPNGKQHMVRATKL